MVARPTLIFGLVSLVVLGLLLPGCIDFNKGGGGHSGGGGGGGGGGAVVPAVPVNIVSPGSVEDERFDGRAPGGFFVGADTIPRLAFLRVTDSNTSGTFDSTEGVVGDTSQVMYTRRRPDGTWTTPIGVSAADGDFKENPILVVVGTGTNAAISFIFWREFRIATAEVHVARVDANDPPNVVSTDTVISDGTLPTGMVGGSTPGSVTAGTLSAVLDTVDGSVFAAWAQFISGDECVVAARYHVGGVGGAGLEPDEKTGITVNNGGAAANVDQDAAPGVQLFFSPTPLVSNATFAPASTGGTVHAIYVSTDADGANLAVRSRTRTAPGAWTPGAPGDVVSDTAAAFYRFPRPTSEGDGDVFLGWTQGAALPTNTLHHAYHSVVQANFDASVVALPVAGGAPTGYGDLAIALDLSVPILAYKRQDAPSGDLLAGSVTGSPNLSGPFAAEQVLKAAIAVEAGEGPGRIYLYREDGTFRIAAVYDAPAAAGAPFDVFGRARPTLGVFAAETNLSATAAVISRLAGFDRVSGSAAQFVWLEGANAGPREVTGVRYDAGTFGAAVNISGSPADSKGGEAGQTFDAGNVGVFGTSSGTPTAHIWWRDVSGAVQHDPFFAQQ